MSDSSPSLPVRVSPPPLTFRDFRHNAWSHRHCIWAHPIEGYAPWNTSKRFPETGYGVGTWPAFLVMLLIGGPAMWLYQTLGAVDWMPVWVLDVTSGATEWASDFAEARTTNYTYLPPDSGDPTEIGFHIASDLATWDDDRSRFVHRPRVYITGTCSATGTTAKTLVWPTSLNQESER